MTEPNGNEPTAQTPGPTAETKEETYTKDQLTAIIEREVGKVKAKEAKKYDALQAEIEALKRANLPDPEKFKAELEAKDKALAEKEMSEQAVREALSALTMGRSFWTFLRRR